MSRHLLTAAILSLLVAALVIGAELSGVRVYDRIATSLCISLVAGTRLQVFMGNSRIPVLRPCRLHGHRRLYLRRADHPAQMKGMALPTLSVLGRDRALAIPRHDRWRAGRRGCARLVRIR
jgi:branched-chain amino acid transport system permease protein